MHNSHIFVICIVALTVDDYIPVKYAICSYHAAYFDSSVPQHVQQSVADSNIRPPEAPKPLNRSSWNLARLIMSSTRP